MISMVAKTLKKVTEFQLEERQRDTNELEIRKLLIIITR